MNEPKILAGRFLAALLVPVVLMLAAQSARAILIITPIAKPGQPVAAASDWPAGLAQLLNDPARMDGWNSFFSETPGDVNEYAFKAAGPSEVNRLVKELAAIKTAKVRVVLNPEKERRADGPGKGAVVVFAMGNQGKIDEWFEQLKEESPGVKIFGSQRLRKPPTALPPTLTIYAGNGAVDLKRLDIPGNVEVTHDFAEAYWKEHKSEAWFAAIDEFLAKRNAMQKAAGL